MLTIGNFLGGMWANESWGRYWGWDPKETWALVSIMVYAFVLHMRLIPGLRGRYHLQSVVNHCVCFDHDDLLWSEFLLIWTAFLR